MAQLLARDSLAYVRSDEVQSRSQRSSEQKHCQRVVGCGVRRVPIPQQEFDKTLVERSKVSMAGIHGLLECLDKALSDSVGRWMVRCASDVVNAVCLGELGELVRCELWNSVTDDDLRNAVLSENFAKLRWS